MRDVLTADLDLYIDPGGDDTNDGLTWGTSFRTIAKAESFGYSSLDLAGHALRFNLGAHVFNEGFALHGPLVGQKGPYGIRIIGRGCGGHTVGPKTILKPIGVRACVGMAWGAGCVIKDIILDGSLLGQTDLIAVGQAATCVIGDGAGTNASSPPVLTLANAKNPSNHIGIAFGGAGLLVMGPYEIMGAAPQCHLDVDNGWVYYNTNGVPGLIRVDVLNYMQYADSFVHCSDSNINVQAVPFICYQGANTGTVTARVAKNGVIDTGSGGNPNIFPGTIAPILTTGGQYL